MFVLLCCFFHFNNFKCTVYLNQHMGEHHTLLRRHGPLRVCNAKKKKIQQFVHSLKKFKEQKKKYCIPELDKLVVKCSISIISANLKKKETENNVNIV